MNKIAKDNPLYRNSLRFDDALARTVLDSLSAHIAIIDENGVILETNRAWDRFARENGMPDDYDHKGSNYFNVCDAVQGDDAHIARQIVTGIREVVSGQLDEFLFDYPCHSVDSRHWYYMRAIRMTDQQPVCVVVSHEEITALKMTEEALLDSQEELEQQKQSLEETNIALKVLLKQRESDRIELEKKFLNNVNKLVLPYVEKLKSSVLKPKDQTLVGIIEDHLRDIVSPLLQQLTHAETMLTPQELSVATLVKDGKSSKEIAEILNISTDTVSFHRKNLREKFGLRSRRVNLRSYLISLSK